MSALQIIGWGAAALLCLSALAFWGWVTWVLFIPAVKGMMRFLNR